MPWPYQGFIKQVKIIIFVKNDGQIMNLLKTLLAAALAIIAISAPAQNGPLLTDESFFAAMDLDRPGLEAVKADVAQSDYVSAIHDYVEYIKGRKDPHWYFDWRDFGNAGERNSAYDTSEADKYASNLLVSCNVWHQFGQTVDWSVNPTPQKYDEWTWQLSRHQFWNQLGKAYWATGEEKYARAFVDQMRSWVIQNTVPDTAEQGPYSRWRTIESGIRMSTSWPEALYRFLASPSFDDSSVVMMIKSMYEHGAYLRQFHRRNNWLTMEMNGLFHVAVLFPEFKASAEWARYASDRLYEEEKAQFYPDGAQVELSTSYHWVSVRNILGIYRLAVLNGYQLPGDYVARLEKTFDVYVNIAGPYGLIPAVNDSEWESCRNQMAQCHECFPEHSDYLFIASDGKQGTEPRKKSSWMPWAGWYTMRSGWDKNSLYAFYEVGPFGAAHQHEDKLSFILYAYGTRVLTEGGRYAYDSSVWRKYVLAARSHNVTRVDGKDQNRRQQPKDSNIFLSGEPLDNRWVSNDSFDFGEGWYTEGFGNDLDRTVKQYRALTFVKDRYWIMIDVFSPSDNSVHSYESAFHFDTSESVSCPKINAVMSADPENANLTIARLDPSAREVRVVTGQEAPEVQGWFPVDGAKVYKCRPVATPVFCRSCAGMAVDPYILVPSAAGESCPVRKVLRKGDGKYVVVFTDGRRDRISFVVSPDGSLSTLSVNGEAVL